MNPHLQVKTFPPAFRRVQFLAIAQYQGNPSKRTCLLVLLFGLLLFLLLHGRRSSQHDEEEVNNLACVSFVFIVVDTSGSLKYSWLRLRQEGFAGRR